MGVSQSKGGDDGGVRWKLRPLVPRSWADLEQLHVRFQQEVHRRRAEPAFQYFLPFSVFQAIVTPLCPDMDKLQLLAMFEALDLKSKRKLAVMDFFSGLALLVDAKKPQKLEYNGGLKTLNKCELTMVVSAASRGLKMFAPGADVLQEATMRPLIRRLFGASNEVLRQTVVNKALADPEILFFMSDLEAGVATSSGELLIQQGKLMKHMAYLDFQAARVTTSVKKYVDARTLQRLIKVVSDGGLSLSQTEATALVGDMTVDQFGLVRCGDILRVMTAWQNRRREKPEALWEIVSIFVIESVTSMEKRMNAALASFDEEGIDLASSVEKAIEQDLVWSSFESLWTKCSGSQLASAIRSEGGVQPVIGKCLRICIDFREDFISDVERAEIPSMLFYTLLNRVRRTGICQLSYSGGTVFKSPQLRQLISLSTSVIIDGGGGLAISSTSRHSLPNLNEQVVDALDACSSTTSSSCPVQSLILCNAPLRPSHSSILATILQRSRRSSSLALVSVVLANVPLAPASVVSLACALAQSPSCLQQLVLERCQVGSAGAAALFEALTYNRALWKLDLSGNHIADAACPALARALLAGSQLRVLALSRNFLSDRGVLGYLAPGLASSQLETLVLLQNPRVSSLGIAALREAAAVSIPSDPSGLRVVSD
ncbi:hypothetical protein JG687_00006990 [Phytophthora cactorum]|uniref:Uncharacterized protein n=1 Tax=Phytophthora cactorum TaxID=29920 RepID=A0A8T1ULB3_9STRA|nr:hypothetical protein JG687_00006990 [Phytophthora cactorum]